ncbi:hypothetical protein ACFWB0_01695 [Rhodococcus sp. NPDC060086]|uniref:hypothetical protein n=1 Tax=Rhodococcus sp. NPDC060086 TaxID=3347055 RepID=UPI0036666679
MAEKRVWVLPVAASAARAPEWVAEVTKSSAIDASHRSAFDHVFMTLHQRVTEA